MKAYIILVIYLLANLIGGPVARYVNGKVDPS